MDVKQFIIDEFNLKPLPEYAIHLGKYSLLVMVKGEKDKFMNIMNDTTFGLPLDCKYYPVGYNKFMVFFSNVVDVSLLNHVKRKFNRMVLLGDIDNYEFEVSNEFVNHLIINIINYNIFKDNKVRKIDCVIHHITELKIEELTYKCAKGALRAPL